MEMDFKQHLSQIPQLQHWMEMYPSAPNVNECEWTIPHNVQMPQDLYLTKVELDMHLHHSQGMGSSLTGIPGAPSGICGQLPLPPPPPSNVPSYEKHMDRFPSEKVNDFKHVIYNMLVDNHNNPKINSFIRPCTIVEDGVIRTGFCFNEEENPDKKLPEMYAQHIRKARLDLENQQSVFIQDLYKFYLRACVELLSKYFEKRDKYTYLYEDIPLFIPNSSLEEAEERIKNMKSRARKKRKAPAPANY